MAKKGGAPTKSEVLTQISKDTGLSRKQVGGVFDSLGGVIKKSLRGNGLFTMPGLMKLKVVKKPATKAREGINPFTGEKDRKSTRLNSSHRSLSRMPSSA